MGSDRSTTLVMKENINRAGLSTEKIWFDFRRELKLFILSKVKDEETANDILQEVFLKVHTQLKQLKDQNSLGKWIYQITRNAINDHFRKRKSYSDVNEIDLVDEAEESVKSDKFMKCMSPFLEKLPQIYKEAITLADLEDLNQNQLAIRLGISYSAAKSRVQRARRLLRSYFEKCCSIVSDRYGNIISHEPKNKCLCSVN